MTQPAFAFPRDQFIHETESRVASHSCFAQKQCGLASLHLQSKHRMNLTFSTVRCDPRRFNSLRLCNPSPYRAGIGLSGRGTSRFANSFLFINEPRFMLAGPSFGSSIPCRWLRALQYKYFYSEQYFRYK